MKNIPLLLRREYYSQRSGIWTLAAFCFSFLLFKRLNAEYFGDFTGQADPDLYARPFNLFLFAGLVFTSITFARTMHSTKDRHAWLMLPVHAHEKLGAKILAHLLFYPVMLVLFIFLSAFLIEGVGGFFWETHVPVFRLMNERFWLKMVYYWTASSLFLLGGAYFRKKHFIKTCLSVILLMAFLLVFTLVAVRVIFHDPGDFEGSLHSWHISGNKIIGFTFGRDGLWNKPRFSRMAAFVSWVIFHLFCWAVTYFRIREKEAKDAV